MRDQIKKLLHATPFQPFALDIAHDVAYSIPTPDHASTRPSFLVIEDDKGCAALIPYEHIRRISILKKENYA